MRTFAPDENTYYCISKWLMLFCGSFSVVVVVVVCCCVAMVTVTVVTPSGSHGLLLRRTPGQTQTAPGK